jgi:hypothetical protein
MKKLQKDNSLLTYATVVLVLLMGISSASIAQTAIEAPQAPLTPDARQDLSLATTRLVQTSTAATQDAAIADKYATVFGAKIHYLEAGSGPVVIFLHGLGGSSANWAPNIGRLPEISSARAGSDRLRQVGQADA